MDTQIHKSFLQNLAVQGDGFDVQFFTRATVYFRDTRILEEAFGPKGVICPWRFGVSDGCQFWSDMGIIYLRQEDYAKIKDRERLGKFKKLFLEWFVFVSSCVTICSLSMLSQGAYNYFKYGVYFGIGLGTLLWSIVIYLKARGGGYGGRGSYSDSDSDGGGDGD